jgi:hypothetical protein
MSISRLIWQFAPALVVFLGAVLVAFGGIWSSWRQSNFNATLTAKNSEIAHLQLENANAITGGNSFAYMVLQLLDPKTAATVIPNFVHQGKYPLYDVQAHIVDLDEYQRLTDRKDFLAASKALSGTDLMVGNLTPGFVARPIGAVLSHPSGQDFTYNVFYVARNGAWTQNLRMRWIGNGWATANRVFAGPGNFGGPGDKELFREVSANYPLDEKGEVDWGMPKSKSAPQ